MSSIEIIHQEMYYHTLHYIHVFVSAQFPTNSKVHMHETPETFWQMLNLHGSSVTMKSPTKENSTHTSKITSKAHTHRRL